MEVPGDPAGSQAVDDGRNRRRVVADHHQHRFHPVGQQRLHRPLDQAQAAQPQQRLGATPSDRSDPLGPARGQHHTHPRQQHRPGGNSAASATRRLPFPYQSPARAAHPRSASRRFPHRPSDMVPAKVFHSTGFTPAARTTTRIRPWPQRGSGASPQLQDLRTPQALNCTTRIQHSSPGLTAAAKCPTAPAVPGDAA